MFIQGPYQNAISKSWYRHRDGGFAVIGLLPADMSQPEPLPRRSRHQLKQFSPASDQHCLTWFADGLVYGLVYRLVYRYLEDPDPLYSLSERSMPRLNERGTLTR
ncbi:hypothetical protein DBV39_01355 [Orrella marina]|uniref:Uncharacterized protein n=1 Tax=Orrella marina TaxID=2163011 RepID=A0A2R4XFK9_9BURK|nr:hypothetical protein DBV39_01355 [Orrella marina]